MTRRRTIALFVITGVLLAACGGNQRTPKILGGNGNESHRVSGLWWLLFGLAAFVYLVVGSFIVIAAVRGRGTPSGRRTRISDHGFIWVGGIIAPLAILMTVAAFTVGTTAALRKPSTRELRINVVGKRWWWAVSYPSLHITTANEIHVPAGQPLAFRLDSDNVIHSFWVPQLAGKVDTIPGQHNYLRFTATKTGTYRGLCAQYCGTQHAWMEFLVIVQTPGDFGRWVAREQELPGWTPANDQQARGEVVFQSSACAGCHTIRGTQAQGDVGPDLTDVGQRTTLGGVRIANSTGNLAGWIGNSQTLKPGNLMPPQYLSPGDLQAVVAYLQSLK
ncbi:MAG: cytochrome c oxidase subunit II [Actinobacteria bacterium]|nr:cytochrome c oxidase subunit II [Actinomycetota bacterium]